MKFAGILTKCVGKKVDQNRAILVTLDSLSVSLSLCLSLSLSLSVSVSLSLSLSLRSRLNIFSWLIDRNIWRIKYIKRFQDNDTSQQISFNLQYLFNAPERMHHIFQRLSFILLIRNFFYRSFVFYIQGALYEITANFDIMRLWVSIQRSWLQQKLKYWIYRREKLKKHRWDFSYFQKNYFSFQFQDNIEYYILGSQIWVHLIDFNCWCNWLTLPLSANKWFTPASPTLLQALVCHWKYIIKDNIVTF